MTPEAQMKMLQDREREMQSIASQSPRNDGERREINDRVAALQREIDRIRAGIFGNTG
jgi:hypothetical protein